jgi:hypothetical protein
MVDLLADGIIASGAEVLADKMKIILRYEDGCTGRQVDARDRIVVLKIVEWSGLERKSYMCQLLETCL